jgi:hypothetical protein
MDSTFAISYRIFYCYRLMSSELQGPNDPANHRGYTQQYTRSWKILSEPLELDNVDEEECGGWGYGELTFSGVSTGNGLTTPLSAEPSELFRREM